MIVQLREMAELLASIASSLTIINEQRAALMLNPEPAPVLHLVRDNEPAA